MGQPAAISSCYPTFEQYMLIAVLAVRLQRADKHSGCHPLRLSTRILGLIGSCGAQVYVWRADKDTGEKHHAFFEDPLEWPKKRAIPGRRRMHAYPLRNTMDALLRSHGAYDAYMAELTAAQEALLAEKTRSTKARPHCSCPSYRIT